MTGVACVSSDKWGWVGFSSMAPFGQQGGQDGWCWVNWGLCCQHLQTLPWPNGLSRRRLSLPSIPVCICVEVPTCSAPSSCLPLHLIFDDDPEPCSLHLLIPAIVPSSSCPTSGGGPSSTCGSAPLLASRSHFSPRLPRACGAEPDNLLGALNSLTVL